MKSKTKPLSPATPHANTQVLERCGEIFSAKVDISRPIRAINTLQKSDKKTRVLQTESKVEKNLCWKVFAEDVVRLVG